MIMLSRWFRSGDAGLLALRISLCAILIGHGILKWQLWGMQPSEQLPAPMLYLMRFLSLAEPAAGLALIAGVWVRLASLLQSLVMLGALNFKINIMHAKFIAMDSTGWELDLIVLASLVCLLFTGGGKYSLEAMVRRVPKG